MLFQLKLTLKLCFVRIKEKLILSINYPKSALNLSRLRKTRREWNSQLKPTRKVELFNNRQHLRMISSKQAINLRNPSLKHQILLISEMKMTNTLQKSPIFLASTMPKQKKPCKVRLILLCCLFRFFFAIYNIQKYIFFFFSFILNSKSNPNSHLFHRGREKVQVVLRGVCR